MMPLPYPTTPGNSEPLPDTPAISVLSLPAGYSAAETHSHTLASDGMVSGVELVRAAAQIGLSVVCITDHDVMNGHTEAIAEGQRLGVDVVRGEEITTKMPPGLHIIGIFLERPVRMGMSVEDTIDAIHDQGGMAIIAHPFMPTYFASMSERKAQRLLESHHVDGIELRHTAPVRKRAWGQLDTFYTRHKSRLGAAIGAGDSHFGINDLGRMVTVFPGSGAADFRKAIEKQLTSPMKGVTPVPPSWRIRLAQQQRSLLWLNNERRQGRVGQGDGPKPRDSGDSGREVA